MSAPEDMAALAGLRVEVARRLAERAADPATGFPELRELHQRLRLIDAGLAASHAQLPGRHSRLALWPVFTVAALVSMAAVVPVRSVPFTLELQARSSAGLPHDALRHVALVAATIGRHR